MIKVYPAELRFSTNHGWLQSNFSFSFAEYYDPANMNFGPLRVFNDDIIQPLKGFGSHPHREMEIVSFVLKGQLKHIDNTGNEEILKAGEVQRMSAGTGIIHSETNPSSTDEVNLLQLWLEPAEKGLTPSYEQKAYDEKALKNRLLPVVSNQSFTENTVHIHQNATFYLSKLDAGMSISFNQEPERKIYIFIMEGDLTLQQVEKLKNRDAARITDLTELEMKTESGSFFMLIDLP